MKKGLIPLAAAAAILLPLFVPSCANTTQSPSGGAKDTIPPALYWTKPAPGSTGVSVKKASVTFGFDEYVTIKTPSGIFLSPPQRKIPKSKVKGKGIAVSFEEDLLPGKTYVLNIAPGAIVDNNENNPFPGFSYAFSTGETLDSMMISGTVLDCSTLKPVKDATVMLYKDHSDSALFKHTPDAAARTDDWGFFVLPYIEDTLYRLYAISDANSDNMYQSETEQVAFIDSLIRPVTVVRDTLPELQKYDMTDTLACLARKSEYTLMMFKEENTKQYLKNFGRVAPRYAFISFMAPNAWIDSLWIRGYKANQLITQFDLRQDSLEIWINDRRTPPDTLQLFVNYRKTNDSTKLLEPVLEQHKLFIEGVGAKKKTGYAARKDLKHEDTLCVFSLTATPELVEQEGFDLTFDYPPINAAFDSLRFHYLNPKQKDIDGTFTVERDTLNPRHYTLRPLEKLQQGYEYFMKVPQGVFRDINGWRNDSTEVKVSLPTDDKLSTLSVVLQGVEGSVIVDLLNEKRDKIQRSYTVTSDCTLSFPYLKAGKYSLRIALDENGNTIIDSGDLLTHRMPERVAFFTLEGGQEYLDIPESSEVEQTVSIPDLFK